MFQVRVYAAAFLLAVAASAAAAQTTVDPSTPASEAEPPASPAGICNLACQLAKSTLTPGGGGGIIGGAKIVESGAGSDQLELGVPRPEADILMQMQRF